MTTQTLPAEDQIRQVRPSEVAAFVLAAFFFTIGFTIGGAWRGLVFCAVSLRYGYWKGLGLSDEEIAARQVPPPDGSAPRSRPRPAPPGR